MCWKLVDATRDFQVRASIVLEKLRVSGNVSVGRSVGGG